MNLQPNSRPEQTLTGTSTYGRAPRMAKEDRRDQLLTTALNAFADGGYHTTSMDDIAAAAGVSKPVLYQHFPGKRELYLALVEHTLVDLSAKLDHSLASSDVNRTRVESMINTHFEFVEHQPQAHRLVFSADLLAFPEVADKLNDFYDGIAGIIASVLGPNVGLPHNQAAMLGRSLVQMVQTAAVYWAQHPGSATRQQAQQQVFRLAWGGISILDEDWQ